MRWLRCFSLLLFAYAALFVLFVEAQEQPYNVVLILVDTLGAHQLKAYGGEAHTPNIDALASTGVNFKRAYSAAPWTKPAIASVFSAQLPSVHKVRRIRDKFEPSIPNLAERLQSIGYDTGGVVSHTLLAPGTGYGSGFKSYEIVPFQGRINDAVTSAQVTDAGIQFLEKRGVSDKPFFLFLHYFDAHYNYIHHEAFDKTSWYKGKLTSGMTFSKFRRAFPKLSKDDVTFMHFLHQEEIAFIDEQIGRLIAHLTARGLKDKTLIVFTADHGEEFGEHGGVGHGHSLYNEVIQVPLVFSLPASRAARSVEIPVSTMDIAPTLLDLLSRPMRDQNVQGYSLKPLIEGSAASFLRPPLFMEVDYNSSFVGTIEGPLKMVLNKKSQVWELFDVTTDLEERRNLTGVSPSEKRLRSAVESFQKKFQANDLPPDEFDPEKEAEGMDPEAVKQLESLGYL